MMGSPGPGWPIIARTSCEKAVKSSVRDEAVTGF